MARLDRRTLQRLEAKHPKVSVGSSNSSDLETYFMAMEDFQRALDGLPPLYGEQEFAELDNDPEVRAYFEELEHQQQERERSLQQAQWRREQHGHF